MTKLALRYESSNPKMIYWETHKGIEFLKQVGLNTGDDILDFGCRVGHYAVPAAKITGSRGTVYAIDTEEHALAELEQKKKAQHLSNIRIIKTFGQLTLPFENESIDIVFFYDVLHYLKKTDRGKLYREAFRVLKQQGLLSIYPKHCLEDDPIMEFQNISLEGVKHEIEMSKFVFDKKYCDLISHDDGLVQGCVLNFIKYKQGK